MKFSNSFCYQKTLTMFFTIYCLSLLLNKCVTSEQATDKLTSDFKPQLGLRHPLRIEELGEYTTHMHNHSADLCHHPSCPLPSIFLTFISSWRDSSWRNLLSVINFSGSHCWKRQKRERYIQDAGKAYKQIPHKIPHAAAVGTGSGFNTVTWRKIPES